MQKLAQPKLKNFTAKAFMLIAVLSLAACSNNPNGGGLFGSGGANSGFGAGGSGAPGSPQELSVKVGDRVFFDTDSALLTPLARETLDRQAQWLNQYQNYSIVIEGHADERGTREYNIALGARRANVVIEYLAAKGINPQRLSTVSFGKERPVAVCENISCWSQNRRAVTTVR